ncbi:MAG: cell division protein FtsA [Candidatus Pacebacteria bacterium]|nr:cell division protein FtsA [Candidatus Paceibacterota bacterium]
MRNISTGINLGSSTVRVVVGEFTKDEKEPKIIGVGEAPAAGMRRGYVVDEELAVESVKRAIAQAEKNAEIKIRKAYLAVNNITSHGDVSLGSTIISKADSEVTALDVRNAFEDAEENLSLGNKKVLQMFPLAYKLDGKEVFGRPEGMHGNKLEVRALFVTTITQHFDNLLAVVAKAGVETIGVMPSIIAGSHLTLSKKQKMAGCLLVDIGAETVSMAVFENENLIYLHTLPIGSDDITNDIALGLKITLEEAESVKLGNVSEKFSKKKVDEIIEARLSDIFELIENHLKKIKRNELLPAGIIFIGAGSNIAMLTESAKNFLKLPTKVGTVEIFGNTKTKLRDPAWYSTLGLLNKNKGDYSLASNSFEGAWQHLKNLIKTNIKQLMP